MPNILIPLVSTESTIQIHIYNKIASDIADLVGADKSSLRMTYNSMEVARTDLKINSKGQKEENTPYTSSRQRFTVNVEDEFDEELIGAEIVNRRDHFPIFRDLDIGVSVAPVYTNNEIRFEFKYITSSKIEIDQIRDKLRMFASRGKLNFQHSVEYTIIVPDYIVGLLKDVHDIKKDMYPNEFEEYMKMWSTNRMHFLTDMSNIENAVVGVKEIQHGVSGEFDFTASPPERVSNNRTNQHGIAMTYIVKMEYPKALTAAYPIAFCNRLMDDKYIKHIADDVYRRDATRDHRYRFVGRSSTVMQNLETSMIARKYVESIYPVNIPSYDEYKQPHSPLGYTCIATLLVSTDNEDPTLLCNLNELDEWYIPDIVKEYMIDNHRRLTVNNASVIFIGLDQGKRHMASNYLTVDKDLNVRSKEPLDMTIMPRVTINICDHMGYLPKGIKDLLTIDREFFLHFLKDYIGVKNQPLLKDPDHYRSQNDEMLAILIRMIHDLYDDEEIATLRTLIKVVSEDPELSIGVGYNLLYSFGNMLYNLAHNGIAYLELNGAIALMSKNPKIAKYQLEKHYNQEDRTHGGYSGRRRGVWTGNNTDSGGFDKDGAGLGWVPGQKEPVPGGNSSGHVGGGSGSGSNWTPLPGDGGGNSSGGGNNIDSGPLPGEDNRENSQLYYGTMKTVSQLGIIAHRRN